MLIFEKESDKRGKDDFLTEEGNDSPLLNLASTYLRCELTFNLDDYWKKESIITGGSACWADNNELDQLLFLSSNKTMCTVDSSNRLTI
jgi:hypothetical protein